MKITDIKIYNNQDQNSDLAGIVQVMFDNCFVVSGLKIMKNLDGSLYIRYPKNSGSKKNLSFYYPVDKQYKEEFENYVIDSFTRGVAPY